MIEAMESWVEAAKTLQRATKQERVHRQAALEAAVAEGHRGKVGKFAGAEVTIRFRSVKATTPRMEEIKEELELLKRLSETRLLRDPDFQQFEKTLQQAEQDLAQMKVRRESMILGEEGFRLKEELEQESASVAGEIRPEIAIRLGSEDE